MTERPASRAALEAQLRDLVPTSVPSFDENDPRANIAVAGASGVAIGFIWGWLRGRRRRK